MKKKAKPVDPSKLLSMSATLLAFAKPLLDQVEDPPTAKSLQNVLNIAVVVWNLPLYEEAKHENATMLVDVIGGSRLALERARQAAAEEVVGAHRGKSTRHLERNIDRVFADVSRHRAGHRGIGERQSHTRRVGVQAVRE
jgi:hypothetical protein